MKFKSFYNRKIIYCLLLISAGLILFMFFKHLIISANKQEQKLKQQLGRLKSLNTTISANQFAVLSKLNVRQRWELINQKDQSNRKSKMTKIDQQDAITIKNSPIVKIIIKRHIKSEPD